MWHCWHANERPFSWLLRWRLRLDTLTNFLPHSSHCKLDTGDAPQRLFLQGLSLSGFPPSKDEEMAELGPSLTERLTGAWL